MKPFLKESWKWLLGFLVAAWFCYSMSVIFEWLTHIHINFY